MTAALDAKEAGLRYVSDDSPGISRGRRGRGFSYIGPDGVPIRDRATLDRIKALAIPPAWTDVWICPTTNGHLQATGRDAKGRKQYRYHADFRARRDEDKYARMERFARVLPRIRDRVDADLGLRGLPRDKVLAAAVRMLERTLIRVGNDEYARDNQSFGLATLRDHHARVEGSEIRLRFRGKSGRVHAVGVRDRRLAAVVQRCRDLPGQDLFQYVDDDGTIIDVRSDDINAYIREAAGSDEFSAKDFRTWSGTVLAFRALVSTGQLLDESTPAPAKRVIERGVREAIKLTAERLGNTPTVARQSYVHPAVIDAYLDEDVRSAILRAADVNPSMPLPPQPEEEAAVVSLLQQSSATAVDAGSADASAPKPARDRRKARSRAARR